jgi:hypothetical protein
MTTTESPATQTQTAEEAEQAAYAHAVRRAVAEQEQLRFQGAQIDYLLGRLVDVGVERESAAQERNVAVATSRDLEGRLSDLESTIAALLHDDDDHDPDDDSPGEGDVPDEPVEG